MMAQEWFDPGSSRASRSFNVLGPFDVVSHGGPIGLPRRDGRILALLLLAEGEVVSTRRLVDAAWSESRTPAHPVPAIQVCISRLRRSLQNCIDADALSFRTTGYALTLNDPEQLDLHVFRRLRKRAEQAVKDRRLDAAVADYRAALDLWRGPALDGLRGPSSVEAAAVELDEQRADLLTRYVDLQVQRGGHAEVIGLLRREIEHDRLRESLSVQLMLCLYRCGRQADALAVGAGMRRRLNEELGVDPSADLRLLETAILRQEPTLTWSPSPVSRRRPRRAPPTPTGASVLVGRDAELARLSDRWTDTLTSRQRSVAVVSGPSGIGKSALLSQLAGHVRETGGRTVQCSCAPEQVVPFQVIAEAATQLVDAYGVETLAAGLDDLQPDLARLVPGFDATTHANASAATGDPIDVQRYRLLEAVRRLVRTAAHDRALVLILDDIQWADRASLAALRHLLLDEPDLPLFLVVATREMSPELHTLLGDGVDVEHVVLSGLAAEEVDVLQRSADPDQRPLTREVSDLIVSLTDGVPFYVLAVLRDLGAPAHQTRPSSTVALKIPSSLRELAQRQIEPLPLDTAELLMTASVLGECVDVRVLSSVTGGSEDAVLVHVDRAVRAGLMHEDVDVRDRFRFTHALTAAHLYGSISVSRRERLHTRIAEVLTTSQAAAGDIARHRWAAQSSTDAAVVCRALLDAAVDSARRVALEDVIDTTGRALDLAQQRPFEDLALVIDLLIVRAPALAALGDGTAARTALLSAVGRARASARPELLLRAVKARQVAGHRVGIDQFAIDALKDVLANTDDARCRAEGLRALAVEYVQAGQATAATRALDEAEALKPSDQDPEALLLRHLTLLTSPGPLDRRLELADRAVASARSLGDDPGAARGVIARLTDLLALGRLDDFENELGRFRELPTASRNPLFRWYACALEAGAAQARGRLDEADRAVGAALAMGQAFALDEALPAYLAQTLIGCLLRNDLGALVSVSASAPPGDDLSRLWAVTHALVAAATGQMDVASHLLNDARGGGFGEWARDWSWLPSMAVSAHTAHLLGDRRSSTEMMDLLLPFGGQFVVAGSAVATLGPVHRYLGLLARTLGRPADAQLHLHKAAAQCTAAGAHAWTAMVNRDLVWDHSGTGPIGQGESI